MNPRERFSFRQISRRDPAMPRSLAISAMGGIGPKIARGPPE